jgi:hypothetical protein
MGSVELLGCAFAVAIILILSGVFD